jgi:hypothetical protein
MSNFRFLSVRYLAALVLAALASVSVPAARAQGGVGDIVYTVGTVSRDSFGRDWAYILWQATTPALISNRVFAVYAKAGDATNNALYIRQSIVTLQTDARVIEPLLRRAENLGDNMFKLQDDLLQIFANLMPSNTISRADQLSAVIRGSLGDPKNYNNLLLLARNHAGINLSLGMADAELIPTGARVTFEVRAYDATLNKDIAVIGRVTLQGGSPTILPQPGPPVLVPELTAKGDLNLRFRWGSPDNLRRLGLMQFGYNLYRVEKTYALAHGWNASTPPPLNALTSLVATPNPNGKRINRAPITPNKQFTLVDAANVLPPGDTNSFFTMDDDGRGRAGYVNMNWTNGAQFFYYVAARDVLGRDGALSQGVLGTVCDKMPPLPPMGLQVVNDYSYNPITKASNQLLRVIWKQSLNTNDLTTNYWIYRWTSLTQMNARSGDFSNNLIAVVSHIPNQPLNSYLDNGPLSPKAATDLGKTYWYTVRAGDAGACGQNLSGPGGPAFGVLRDRVGPAAGNGFIDIICTRPFVQYRGTTIKNFIQTNDLVNYDWNLFCTRTDSRFQWAEFYAIATYNTIGGPVATVVSNYFGRLYFLGGPTVSAAWTPPRNPNGQQYAVTFSIRCRAGLSNGKVSDFAFASNFEVPNDRQFANVQFDALLQSFRTTAGNQKDRDCYEHDPGGGAGGVDGTNNIIVHVFPSPGSKEYRIYRRVDSGPLSLLCQGAVTNIASIIDCFENAPPVNGGTICFYVQLLDENGNPSPMTPIGCIDTAPNSPLPVPTLTKMTATGDQSSPGMNISWFCPPYGVDRFELRVAGLPTGPDTSGFNFSAQLSYTSAPPASMTFSNFGTNLTLSFYSFITPKAGPGFGNNGAVFLVPAGVQFGKTYIMSVRALGQNGNAGEFSNFETFVWNPTNAASPQVPWPARGLPSTNASFPTIALFLSPTNAAGPFQSGDFTGIGVLVGADVLNFRVTVKEGPARIFGTYDPMQGLITNNMGEVIFPVAMYRYQVPNPAFPTVSGDVIQVSPLMEKVAYQLSAVPGSPVNTIVQDPFMVGTTASNGQFNNLYLWIKDTQPQITGARYKYLLVRFKANREIDQIIQSNEVDVP